MATYASTTFHTDDSAIGVDVDREQTERRQQTDGNQHEETAEQIGSATREIGLRGQGVNHQSQNNDARRGKRADEDALINEDTTTSDQEGLEYRLQRDETSEGSTNTNSIMISVGCCLMPTHHASSPIFTARGARNCERSHDADDHNRHIVFEKQLHDRRDRTSSNQHTESGTRWSRK